MATRTQTIDDLCINTIRTLAIDAVEKAHSGHPGLPMGAARAEELGAPIGRVFWPDADCHAHYREARLMHLRVEEALRPLQEAFRPAVRRVDGSS